MTKACKEKNVDIVLLSETNTKWLTFNKKSLERKFSTIQPRAKISASSTNVNINEKSDFLPRGTMSAVWGRMRNLLKLESLQENEYGF